MILSSIVSCKFQNITIESVCAYIGQESPSFLLRFLCQNVHSVLCFVQAITKLVLPGKSSSRSNHRIIVTPLPKLNTCKQFPPSPFNEVRSSSFASKEWLFFRQNSGACFVRYIDSTRRRTNPRLYIATSSPKAKCSRSFLLISSFFEALLQASLSITFMRNVNAVFVWSICRHTQQSSPKESKKWEFGL